MENPNITPGNGLILYYKTDKLETIRKNIIKMEYPVEEDVNLNSNSTKREFSMRDLNGYYWTISEYHEYKG